MLAQPVTRRSFLAGAALVLLAKPRRPRPPKPSPLAAAPTFRLRASTLRGGYFLRGGL